MYVYIEHCLYSLELGQYHCPYIYIYIYPFFIQTNYVSLDIYRAFNVHVDYLIFNYVRCRLNDR